MEPNDRLSAFIVINLTNPVVVKIKIGSVTVIEKFCLHVYYKVVFQNISQNQFADF